MAFFALDYPGGPIHIGPLVALLPVVAARPAAVWLPLAVGGAAALTVAATLADGWSSGNVAAVGATIVRLVLVPAVMQLLGRANWWRPRLLDRLLPPAGPIRF